ncbi:MAG TPA: DUF6057 family protein [Sedimentisphaerales bacterium]|nr:DUF6057 family protein [Sedimentisphaerales bacterium]
MAEKNKNTAKNKTTGKWPLYLFATVIFLLSWLWIKPALVFFGQGRTICMDIYTPWKNILDRMPFYPGLYIDWLASVLSYIFFHFDFIAAIILTAIAISLYITAYKITQSLGQKNLKFLCSIPAAILIIQYARYYHWIAEPISILLAATSFYYYNKTELHPKIKLTLFFISTILIYIIIPKGLLVFALLCIATELSTKKFYNSLALFFLATLSPWICNLLLFKTDLIETYQRILIFHSGQGLVCNIILNISAAYWPMLIILCKTVKNVKIGVSKSTKILYPALPAILVITAVFTSADYTERNKRLIDYYGYHQNWDKLLDYAKTLREKDYDKLICHDVNRALYHKDRLTSDMFDYPQHYQSLLLNNKDGFTGGILWLVYPKLGDIYYELAEINQAEYYTSEALELLGYYPHGLKQLTLINIIKQQYPTAKVYLKTLRKDPLYRKWAENYLDKLNHPELFDLDKDIMEKRNLWVGKDSDLADRYAPLDLFMANPENKMAFEYMMAFCLLTGQYSPVANSIKYLNKYDYPKGCIPKLYEQAILLYTQITGKKADLAGRELSSESLKTFQLFAQKASATEDMTAQQAEQVLVKDFKNTYYYYYHFLRPEE